MAEQENPVFSPVRCHGGDVTGRGGRSEASGRRDLILRHPAHLGTNSATHPHIHCVVPGGGLSMDRSRWISSRPNFFLPVKVLSRVFRGKFCDGLQRAFEAGQLAFFGECLALADEENFTRFLRTVFQHDWVVYSKPPFGGPD